MNALTTFSDMRFGEIRTTEESGKVLFCGSDVARALGYVRPADAISAHCKEFVILPTPSNGGTQNTKFITEGDVYRLITHSKLPAAEKFERWVFDDVLPQIRRNDSYIGNIEEIISKTATAVAAAVVRQLLPLTEQKHEKPVVTKSKRKKRQSNYKQPSIMEQLSPELKNHVDGMIASNAFSCQGIANYLMAHGVQVSQVSVNKYAHKYFWDKEVQK